MIRHPDNHACVIFTSKGFARETEVERARALIQEVLQARFSRCSLVLQRVVDLPCGCLSAKERAYRSLILQSIRMQNFSVAVITGSVLTEFAREAALAARAGNVPLQIKGFDKTQLRRYGEWFRAHEARAAYLTAEENGILVG